MTACADYAVDAVALVLAGLAVGDVKDDLAGCDVVVFDCGAVLGVALLQNFAILRNLTRRIMT